MGESRAVPAALKNRLGRASGAVLEELDQGGRALTALLLLMPLAAAFQLWVTRGLTFYADEYILISQHLGFTVDDLVGPMNGSLNLVPILIYQVLIAVFGLDTYLPFRLLLVGFTLLCPLLLFLYLRLRVTPWLAFAPAAFLMFFGGAWQDLATSVGLLWLISAAAGLGALLALERRDGRGDLAAAVLLALSLASHTPGLAFAAGAAVTVALRPDPWRWRQVAVWAVPFVLYVLWSIWSEHRFHESPTMLSNLYLVPTVVVQAFSGVLAALGGLYGPSTGGGLYDLRDDLAVPVALAAIGGAAWLLVAGRLRREALVGIAMALVLWLGLALVNSPARLPTDSRYLYPGVIFVVIAAAGALGPRRPTPRAWIAVGLVFCVGLVPNLFAFHNGAEYVKANTRKVRAELAAVELARDTVQPGFTPDDATGQQLIGFLYLVFIQAGPYLQLVDAHGSPAFSASELGSQPDGVRRAADITLARALELTLRPAPAPAPSPHGPGCEQLAPGIPQERPVAPGGTIVISPAAGMDAAVSIRRFSDAPAYVLGSVPGGTSDRLTIPRDRADEPWRVTIVGAGPVTVCARPPAPAS